MRDAQKILETKHSEMVKEIQKDIEKKQLAADVLIRDLFSIGSLIERTSAIVARARERMDLGNPPGKKGSLGDAVNWECLMAGVPKHVSLYLIADDSDFYSPLNSNTMNDFLEDEWKSKKESGLKFYRKLSDFFKDHYPSINLETELQKDALIETLASSPNFATTHALIAQLSKYDGFTQKQIEDLVNALLMNNQINWIITDEDVHNFYKKLYDTYFFSVIDYHDELDQLLNPVKQQVSEDEATPF